MNLLWSRGEIVVLKLFKTCASAVGLFALATGCITTTQASPEFVAPCLASAHAPEVEGGEDLDGDGLQDSWEIQFFGNLRDQCGTDDPDGDGVNNAAELAAGTNPTDRWD